MLSLPLVKISTARDVDASEQRFEWEHETCDLLFVLDSYGGASKRLKVVQGTQVRVSAQSHRRLTRMVANCDFAAIDRA